MQISRNAHFVTNWIVCTVVAYMLLLATDGQSNSEDKPAARAPLKFDGARGELYKSIGDVQLFLYIFEPAGRKASDARPAAIFFFGGGWNGGTPAQFEPHARYLASRGMVAIVADYRVKSRHGGAVPVDSTGLRERRGSLVHRCAGLHANRNGARIYRCVW